MTPQYQTPLIRINANFVKSSVLCAPNGRGLGSKRLIKMDLKMGQRLEANTMSEGPKQEGLMTNHSLEPSPGPGHTD